MSRLSDELLMARIEEAPSDSPIMVYRGRNINGNLNSVFAETVLSKMHLAESPEKILGVFCKDNLSEARKIISNHKWKTVLEE